MRRTLFMPIAMAAVLVIMLVCTVHDFHAKVHAQNVPVAGRDDVKSEGCRNCHAPFYAAWSASAHGLSIQPYSDDFARQALVPQKSDITAGKRSYRIETAGGRGIMLEKGAWAWSGKEYRITHVLGGRDVCYFFTQAENGRLTALPLAFDSRRRIWIERSAGGIRHAELEAQGSEEPLVFNTACYGCHVSPLSTNYDLKTDSYRTEIPEPGIRCEACHGRVKDHDIIMKNTPGGAAPKDLKVISAKGFTARQHNETCAPCHARTTPITVSYVPGEPFFDHYDLATIEGPDFSPDGRAQGETDTYTSWLMSPCARSGRLSCLHCHTPGGGYRFGERTTANNACMPCHEKTVSNLVRHTHHAPLSPGSMCISCHMPGSGSGNRHLTDHSMLPPAPASSMLFKSPNACITCHHDKDDAWADQWARKWYRADYQDQVLRRARLLDAARKRDWSRLEEIRTYIRSVDRDEVYAASLLRLLNVCPDPAKEKVLTSALNDSSPLVRSVAAEELGSVLSPEAVRELTKAAADPVRIVRIKAASALIRQTMVTLPGEDARILSRATGEYLGSLMVRQDHWASHVGMGTYFLDQGDARNALTAFKTASRLNPRAVEPYVRASLAYAKLRDRAGAENELNNALRIDPEYAPALFAMGMLKNEQGKPQEAVTYLKEALKSDPTHAAAAFNLGIILSADSMKEAIVWARKAYELQPDAGYGYTFANFLKQDGDWNEGIEVLRQVIGRHPLHTDAYLLLGELYEKKGKVGDAESIYRQGLSVQGMPGFDRSRIEKRLKKLR